MNELTKEEIDLLVQNKIIPEGTPIAQIQFFSEVCKRKKLDPFLRQVHMVERKEQKDGIWKKSYTIQASLDGMRAISQRNGKIKSVKRGVKKENDELYGWCEITTIDGGIYYDEVPFSEYVQKTKDGNITHFWKQFPQTMIKKVAEESVRRMADPEDLSGIYGDTEMLQADNPLVGIAEKSSIKMPEPATEISPSSDIKSIEVQGDIQVVEEIQEGKQRIIEPHAIIAKEVEELYAEPKPEIELPKGESENVTSFLDQSIQEIQKISEDWIDKQEEENKTTPEKEKTENKTLPEDTENIGMPVSEFEKKPVDFHYANQCRQFKGIVGEKVYYDLLNTYGRAGHSTDLRGASKVKFLRTIKELAIKAGWKEEE